MLIEILTFFSSSAVLTLVGTLSGVIVGGAITYNINKELIKHEDKKYKMERKYDILKNQVDKTEKLINEFKVDFMVSTIRLMKDNLFFTDVLSLFPQNIREKITYFLKRLSINDEEEKLSPKEKKELAKKEYRDNEKEIVELLVEMTKYINRRRLEIIDESQN